MKKIYLQPTSEVVTIQSCNKLLSGSPVNFTSGTITPIDADAEGAAMARELDDFFE